MFSTGNFIELLDGRIVRLDHLFVHSVNGQCRLSANITPTKALEEVEAYLGIPKLHLDKEKEGRFGFVALRAVIVKKLYIVPIKVSEDGNVEQAREPEDATELLFVQGTLQ